MAKVALDLQKIIFHLQKDLEPCHELGGQLKVFEQWASIFETPEELGETITLNYFSHRQTVGNEIKEVKTDMAAQQYFEAGEAFGDIAITLIGEP